jgi:hypothetical protein
MVTKGAEMVSKKIALVLAVVAIMSFVWGVAMSVAVVYRVEPIEQRVAYNTGRIDKLIDAMNLHTQEQSACIARLETVITQLTREVERIKDRQDK